MERSRNDQSNEQNERVLDHFIDPLNPRMNYENFARQTLEMFLGDENSVERKKLEDGLYEVYKDVKDAREFNDTYLGHMLSEASIPGMWGYMLAMRLGGNTVAREVSEMESRLEPEAIRGLMDIIGYDKEKASGTFTSGGSMAVFTALDVAVKRIKKQFDVQKKQMSEPLIVFYNPLAHYSFDKAVDALGGPNRMIEKIAVGTNGFKMNPRDLEEKIKTYHSEGRIVAAIFAIAGETETGLVDPLNEIADLAQKYRIFSIADGAYGVPYKLSRKGDLFTGLERFGAVIVDGHKALYTPYSNGAVLFRDKRDHVLLNLGVRAPYVKFERNKKGMLRNLGYENEKFSLGEKRLEGSGGAGSILSTVAVLRTLGQEGLATIYDITLDRIDYLYNRLKQSEILTPAHEPDINLLCFRIKPKVERKFGINKKKRSDIVEKSRFEVDRELIGKGGYFFSSTDINLVNYRGRLVKTSVWRACLMNPRTSNTILDEAVTALEESVLRMLRASR